MKSIIPNKGQEDSLEKEMETIPIFLPGKSHKQRSLAATVYGVSKNRRQLATKQW